MPPRQITVFFYGLFIDAELLRAKGVQPSSIRPASVPGFALRIGKRATLVPAIESCAHGFLMDLSHTEIEQLYSEACVSAYRPEAVLAQLPDGSFIPALCFTLPVPPALDEANPEYAAKLRELAERLNLPADYIKGIR